MRYYDANIRFETMHSEWIRLSREDDCPAKIFLKLYRDVSTNAHCYLKEGLKNPNLNKETLDELAHCGIDEIVDLVAINPNVSKDTLEYLYDLKYIKIRSIIAKNKNIHHKLLKKLLNDENRDVFFNALLNRNTTFQDIESLINSKKHKETMCKYLKYVNNKNILEQVYKIDKLDKQYLKALVLNENISESIIDDILSKYDILKDKKSDKNDEENPATDLIKKNLTFMYLDNTLKQDDMDILKNIISNKNVKEKNIIMILKKYPIFEDYISSRITSMYLSNNFINELIEISQGSILYTISTFCNLSEENIKKLYYRIRYIKDEDVKKKIIDNLIRNNTTPTNILDEIYRESVNIDLNFDNIVIILCNHNCPTDLFHYYYNDNEEYNKVIAKNPKTPIYILEEIYKNMGFRRKKYLTSDYFGENLNRLKQHLLDKQHNKFKSIANSYIEEEPLNEKINNAISKEKNITSKKAEIIKEIFTLIESLKSTIDKLEQNNLSDDITIKSLLHSIVVPRDILLVKVDDHYEINSEFIGALKFINFKLISTENLKVSGMDFRDTNIEINPQLVYKKDLSNSLFDDENIFGSFDGVNLCGADISKETFLIDMDKAIKDDKTKLPKKIAKER